MIPRTLLFSHSAFACPSTDHRSQEPIGSRVRYCLHKEPRAHCEHNHLCFFFSSLTFVLWFVFTTVRIETCDLPQPCLFNVTGMGLNLLCEASSVDSPVPQPTLLCVTGLDSNLQCEVWVWILGHGLFIPHTLLFSYFLSLCMP